MAVLKGQIEEKKKMSYCGGGLTHWEEGYFQTLH
jgi:hypothetical protein